MWVDFNRDEDFEDAGEMVLEQKAAGVVTGRLTIPSNVAKNREVGIRISTNDSSFPEPCGGDLGWGEVEDYRAIFDGGAPSDIIATDGFESFGWKGGKGPWLGPWKKSGNVKKVKKNPFAGKKYARLVGNKAKLEREVDLTGAHSAILKFAMRVRSFEKGDTALVQVGSTGKSLEVVKTFTDADSDNVYHEYSLDIPAHYLGGKVRIVFDAEMNKKKDYLYIDSVEVIGVK